MTVAYTVTADRTYDVGVAQGLTQTPGGRLRVEAVQADANGTIGAASSNARMASAANSINPTSVKSAAGRVFLVTGYNSNAAARYLKIYNKASVPTVGTDVPVWVEYLPAQAKFNLDLRGFYLSAGIAYALTTGVADNDTGALSVGDVLALNMAYS